MNKAIEVTKVLKMRQNLRASAIKTGLVSSPLGCCKSDKIFFERNSSIQQPSLKAVAPLLRVNEEMDMAKKT